VDPVAGVAVAGVDADRRALHDETGDHHVVRQQPDADREAVTRRVDHREPGRVRVRELRGRR
jgi:hypothetical protein